MANVDRQEERARLLGLYTAIRPTATFHDDARLFAVHLAHAT